MWITWLKQKQQKAIDLLTDEQLAKLTHAKAGERFDLLTTEQKANFLGKDSKELKAFFLEIFQS